VALLLVRVGQPCLQDDLTTAGITFCGEKNHPTPPKALVWQVAVPR